MNYHIQRDKDVKVVDNITVGDFLNLPTYRITDAQRAKFDVVPINDQLIKLLKCMTDKYRGWEIGLTDHGGYRPKKPVDLNKMVQGAGSSMHTNGSAADFYFVKDGKRLDAAELAVATEAMMVQLGMQGGVGIYGPGNQYIHVDTGVRNGWMAWFETTRSNGLKTQGGKPCVFKKGARAAGVKLVQRWLDAHGYECGSADGIYGANTMAAVKQFQKDNGLAVDGIFGKNTNNAMGNVLPW